MKDKRKIKFSALSATSAVKFLKLSVFICVHLMLISFVLLSHAAETTHYGWYKYAYRESGITQHHVMQDEIDLYIWTCRNDLNFSYGTYNYYFRLDKGGDFNETYFEFGPGHTRYLGYSTITGRATGYYDIHYPFTVFAVKIDAIATGDTLKFGKHIQSTYHVDFLSASISENVTISLETGAIEADDCDLNYAIGLPLTWMYDAITYITGVVLNYETTYRDDKINFLRIKSNDKDGTMTVVKTLGTDIGDNLTGHQSTTLYSDNTGFALTNAAHHLYAQNDCNDSTIIYDIQFTFYTN